MALHSCRSRLFLEGASPKPKHLAPLFHTGVLPLHMV